jgi:hypothetical protein
MMAGFNEMHLGFWPPATRRQNRFLVLELPRLSCHFSFGHNKFPFVMYADKCFPQFASNLLLRLGRLIANAPNSRLEQTNGAGEGNRILVSGLGSSPSIIVIDKTGMEGRGCRYSFLRLEIKFCDYAPFERVCVRTQCVWHCIPFCIPRFQGGPFHKSDRDRAFSLFFKREFVELIFEGRNFPHEHHGLARFALAFRLRSWMMPFRSSMNE